MEQDDPINNGDGSVDGEKRKRGRPRNPNKVPKVPSERGRGRPRKDGTHKVIVKKERVAFDSDNERQTSRGRPKKLGKLKLRTVITATGRGRGRPKTVTKSSVLSDVKRIMESMKNSKKNIVSRGRPRKVTSSSDDDDETSEIEEDRRPVGRPSTNAINLNIIATGRGQGRPSQASLLEEIERDVSVAPRKRGRPSLGKKVTPVKGTGVRGRPKKTENNN